MESSSCSSCPLSWKTPSCIGMPVMIRNNDATELCITKGQEGFVTGWTSHNGVHGKEVLDTLFVKLDKPAKSVKIDGLFENVVPIVKSVKTVKCVFPSDLAEYVERSQVWVLPLCTSRQDKAIQSSGLE